MAAMNDQCECDVDWESDDNGGGYVVVRCRLCEAKLRLADHMLAIRTVTNAEPNQIVSMLGAALFHYDAAIEKEIADGKEQKNGK